MSLDQKEVTLQGKIYILTALPASFGLDMQMRLQALAVMNQPPPADLIKEAICKGASIASAKITPELFDRHFARKYSLMLDLYSEIYQFNFGGDEDPNAVGDTSDQ